MATPAHQIQRFLLPGRIRASNAALLELPSTRILADRIAELPGVEAAACDGDALQLPASVYFLDAGSRRTIRNPRRQILCRLSAEDITIFGLDNWAKHQVVMRGWGKLLSDRVLLFLPRDENELEICWSILRHAYDSIYHLSARSPGNDYRSIRNLPSFSRTTLQ